MMGNLRKNTQKGPSPSSSRRATDSAVTPEKNNVEQIRHILFPPIPIHGVVSFHATKQLFFLIALGLQYLNIYRTVWWLGRPWVKYSVDIGNVDFYLVFYILLMLIISPLYDAYQNLYWKANTPLRILNCILIGIFGLALWCSFQFHMLTRINYDSCIFGHPYLGFLLVIYQPIIFFFIYYYAPAKQFFHFLMGKFESLELWGCVFSFPYQIKLFFQAVRSRSTLQSIRQFFFPSTPRLKRVNKTPRYSPLMPIRYAMIPHPSSNSIATFYTLRMPSKQQLAILKHSCARCSPAITENAAQMIRDEAEVFYTDFNARLFDIVVGTVVSTFYCTILPCLFVPKGLNLDLVWCFSHTLLTALTFLLLHWQYLLPPAHLDLLHRCALHLGGWQELSPSAHSGYLNWPAWSLFQTYPKGVQVKHVRGLFQSMGASNAAEPGNPSHSRIFFWFSSPTTVMNGLCYAAVVVSLAQMCVLEWTFEWNKLIGLAAVSPFVLLNLYRLLRNRTILTWVWDDDNPVYEPPPTPPQTTNAVNSVKT